jgi:hypothetical protein
MVTVFRGSNWKIAVYGREHGVPHFHIEGPDFRASIGIETLELIIGNVPQKTFAEAKAWALQNQSLLMDIWRELNA